MEIIVYFLRKSQYDVSIKNSELSYLTMYYFIVNPVAGGGRTRKIFQQVQASLENRGIFYEFDYTKKQGHATQLAQQAVEAGKACIVCVGGDGTVMEVAQGMVSSPIPMGILPTGTGNDFCKSLGISADPMEALEQLLRGKALPVDVGSMGGQVFLNAAGIGFDADVIMHMQKVSKRLRGLAAYVVGVMKAVVHLKMCDLQVCLNGERLEQEALMVVVANGRYFGGGMKVCPKADPRDGLLDVLVIDRVSRAKLLLLLSKFISGKHLGLPMVKYYRCQEVSIEGKADFMEYDGCLLPFQGGTYQIKTGMLNIYLPA